MTIAPLPAEWTGLLERYRLRSRQQYRSGLSGGHLMRRRGQSLEFREFMPYTPGDDIRHVDWRASARHGATGDLLIRRFMAEEQLSLVISVDVRETMTLPEAMPKLLIACWIAEALARMAVSSGDRVLFHALYGKGRLAKPDSNLNSCRFPASLLAPSQDLNLGVLDRHLPPASIWLVITDCYFEPSSRLAARIATAQAGNRQVILLDLDTWPYEQTVLGSGPRQLEGPGLNDDHNRFDINTAALDRVQRFIDDHKHTFLERSRVSDHIVWRWPAEQPDPHSFFKRHFFEDEVLQSLFRRDF